MNAALIVAVLVLMYCLWQFLSLCGCFTNKPPRHRE